MQRINVLVVLTNTREFPRRGQEPGGDAQHYTGFDIKEVAYLWEQLCRQNCSLIFASPRGGEAHIDPGSEEASRNDETVAKFMKDQEAMRRIKDTRRLHDCAETEFVGAVFPGGVGVVFDLPHEPLITELIRDIYPRRYGFIAAIGHGLAALLNVKNEQGEYWLDGKRVTCQTVEEEKELRLEHSLPFMLEERVRQTGAKVEKAGKFSPKVVEDERLITAQNNRSVKEWVEVIGRHCRAN